MLSRLFSFLVLNYTNSYGIIDISIFLDVVFMKKDLMTENEVIDAVINYFNSKGNTKVTKILRRSDASQKQPGAKFTARMKARVSLNSSSVSWGKPVMRSVVMATFSKCSCSRRTDSMKRAVSYLRFMRFSVASEPLCRDRWNWGQRFL